ncbi:MAG: carbonic anhydrase [Geobacter sp.]|nr:carbonic anhydrase [Geobacter sp.]
MIRNSLLGKVATVIGLLTAVAGLAFASTHVDAGMTPDEALQKMMDGNKRYVENQMTGSNMCGAATRTSLAKSQKPYAIVLTCSDSRVPPEIIFDKGLGEIFVIRVAGNVPDPIVLGSIEYAAEHLSSPLLMVLGHERCGAVSAAVGAKGKSTGSANIDAIIKAISPNIKPAAKSCDACKGEAKCADTKKEAFIECVVDANAKAVAAGITKKSKILKHLVETKKLKVVAAKYDLDDGAVTVLK